MLKARYVLKVEHIIQICKPTGDQLRRDGQFYVMRRVVGARQFKNMLYIGYYFLRVKSKIRRLIPHMTIC